MFGFMKKKVTDRYEGKPFLKLVDSFVLKCIGELDQASESSLQQATPKFQQVFHHNGSWEDIVVSELNFGPDIQSEINKLWIRNQQIAKENKVILTPRQFVEMFVDNNVMN